MKFEAIEHRSTPPDCYALNQEELVISLRTGYDVESVYLHYGDPYLSGIMGGGEKWTGERVEFTETKRLAYHLSWSIKVNPVYKRCKYYFELHTQAEHVLYFEDGFYTDEKMKDSNKMPAYFIFPWMNPIDLFQTPDWVSHTIWYQIFPDRFCNGNPSINPGNVKVWRYEKQTLNDCYGGDLRGVIDKLDYLKDLGITGLYLTPLFEADSNHKYDTRDYYRVDPSFGTNDELKELVHKAHQNGIRVMLDGVFNHTGANFPYWLDVLEKGKSSVYADWYMVNRWPVEQTGETRDGRFYSFAFSESMPKLNTSNPEVRRYLLGIVRTWIEEFDIDGLRLDVGNEVSHELLKELRRLTKELKDDFYLLGEIWHDAGSWLRGDEYDAVMNYPLAAAISDFWIFNDLQKDDFESAINRCFSRYQEQASRVMFNLLDSHDTDRLMNQVGDIDVFYQQLVILFTMPGSPCIFYGTEIAMEGGHDPDCRRCMPWGEIEAGMYGETQAEIKQMIRLRQENITMQCGDLQFINNFKQRRLVEYQKIHKQQTLTVLINSDVACNVLIPDGSEILYARKYEHGVFLSGGILIYLNIK